jgi:hypothetical protein
MRNVQPVGQQIAELQMQLYELLFIEMHYELLDEVLGKNSLQNAMIKLDRAISDLLHLENHGSHAILTHICLSGL